MHAAFLDLLRCPFCGTSLTVVENEALVRTGDGIEQGVLGCQCCAFPVVAGIPILIADDASRRAIDAVESGRGPAALLDLLAPDADEQTRARLSGMVGGGNGTYREALGLLCDDAEGTYLRHRLADPTYVTMEAVLGALAQDSDVFGGRVLDLCGGAGHVTRLLAQLGAATGASEPARTVLADLHFWKLWLAKTFVAPGVEAVVCNADSPLPFARDCFSAVLLADAFPYIWHKRLAVEEMMRVAGDDGVVVMPHLHSSLGENHSAGDTLTPAAYRDLFHGSRETRLFSDAALLDDVLERRVVDLTDARTPDELGDEASFTLVSSARSGLFRRHEIRPSRAITGALLVNPLYRVDADGSRSTLTLDFPTPEYEDEFGACRRYLPEQLSLDIDVTRPISPESLGNAYAELRDRRVLIDAPAGY